VLLELISLIALSEQKLIKLIAYLFSLHYKKFHYSIASGSSCGFPNCISLLQASTGKFLCN
jgi:hypothetical protein